MMFSRSGNPNNSCEKDVVEKVFIIFVLASGNLSRS